jgi:Tfp pilus assembly protein PilV
MPTFVVDGQPVVFVMMPPTSSAGAPRSPVVAPAPGSPARASERGDTLIEVLVSALLIAVITAATLFGLDSTNRATAIDRARSQADALAQQDEEQLRSEPVSKLSELNRSYKVVQGRTSHGSGTTYTITSTSQYVSDATATASCTSSKPTANYLLTTSKVTWPSMGNTKPVSETSIISPPVSSSLIGQVTNSGTAVSGATVRATGPSPETTANSVETSVNGCGILALSPGNYALNVSKPGYVTENWYENTSEDAHYPPNVYLVAASSTKKGFNLAPAGKLEVKFSGSTPAEGDSFVAFNSNMTTFRLTGTVGTYATAVTAPKVFPAEYTVYAGICEADKPSALKVGNPEVTKLKVPASGSVTTTVVQPPVKIKVMTGTGPGASTEGTVVTTGTGYTRDTGCNNAQRSFASTPLGALPRPGLPYGKYTMCVAAGGKHWEGALANDSPTGPSAAKWTNANSVAGVAPIYLGTSPVGSPAGVASGVCP